MLESIVRAQSVKFVAEEVNADKMPNVQSVARDTASSINIPWKSIDMTAEQRKDAGIYDELATRPFVRFDPVTGLHEERVYFRRADGIREEFWLDQIAEANPSGNVLIICGYSHLEFLIKRVVARGWTAAKEIYLPAGEEAYSFKELE